MELGYGPLDDDLRLEPVDRYEISGMMRLFKGTPVEDKLRAIAADAHADAIPWTLFEDVWDRMCAKYLPPRKGEDYPDLYAPIPCEHHDKGNTLVWNHSQCPHRCDQENHFGRCPWWERNGWSWTDQQERLARIREEMDVSGHTEWKPYERDEDRPPPRPFEEQQTEKFIEDSASFTGSTTFAAAVQFVKTYGLATDHFRMMVDLPREWDKGMIAWIARRLEEERRLRWDRWDLTLAAESMGWETEEEPDLAAMTEEQDAAAITLLEPFLMKLFVQSDMIFAEVRN